MSKEDKKNDIEKEQVDGAQNEAVEVEEPVVEEQTAEEKLEADLKQEKDKFLRLFAEFENYKRRTAKERIELFATASEGVMKNLLPILDDFERALSHIEDDKEAEELRKGVLLIYQKLVSTLEKDGLKAIEVANGDVFDADIHEAITQIPAPSDDLKGKIIDTVEKGYKLGDKIIRFPKVVIGQ
ncbi:nucleotide exchange factor GrpE [Tamlana fucoidanivorans]|uniref:Protein GrpE n=1 Tax=Allotamlana fucoidanivorans TaxID=2583814 RepID=A0A5C4SHP6_9FLAO|nr:nucleotide exchange factor GrpE [Tamlana fucoidanivorans]TNJ42872.1 nucleotide exchange factor GrpE [Tamlana fucoidanivorans]